MKFYYLSQTLLFLHCHSDQHVHELICLIQQKNCQDYGSFAKKSLTNNTCTALYELNFFMNSLQLL